MRWPDWTWPNREHGPPTPRHVLTKRVPYPLEHSLVTGSVEKLMKTLNPVRSYLILLVGVLCSSAALAFTSAKHGYSVTAPSGWTAFKHPSEYVEFSYESFDAQSSIYVEVFSETYAEMTPARLKESFDAVPTKVKEAEFILFSRRKSTLAGRLALETLVQKPAQNENSPYVSQELRTVHRFKGYILTFEYPVGQYSRYKKAFDAVRASFKFQP